MFKDNHQNEFPSIQLHRLMGEISFSGNMLPYYDDHGKGPKGTPLVWPGGQYR